MPVIDKEFQSICPAQTAEEIKLLTESILTEGCREPIVTWSGKDIVIDGHTRFTICTENKVDYTTYPIPFECREDALLWILRNQLGRRNLNESQRALLAARLSNIPHGGDRKTDHVANLQLETLQEVAEKNNVSKRSVSSAKRVLESGDKKLISAVKDGKVSVSKAEKIVKAKEKPVKEITPPKPGSVIKKSGLWGEIEGLLGKALNRTDSLNREFPHPNNHKILLAQIKICMNTLESWKQSKR